MGLCGVVLILWPLPWTSSHLWRVLAGAVSLTVGMAIVAALLVTDAEEGAGRYTTGPRLALELGAMAVVSLVIALVIVRRPRAESG